MTTEKKHTSPRVSIPRRLGLLLVPVGAAALAAGPATLATYAATADAAYPSAIPNEAVNWIEVSPAFTTTGTALAETTVGGQCGSSCFHLWVTHDGGASWARAAAAGWKGGYPHIAVDGKGHEVMLAGIKGSAQRSDDGGASWQSVAGSGGMPVAAPTFGKDGTMAVASMASGGGDYVVTTTGTHSAPGSGGALADISFMFAPTYPSSGSQPPALLSAADPKSGLPVIQQCSSDLSCHGSSTLPGAVTFSLPVALIPSTGYANDKVVFAQSGRGIYKSTDAGTTFSMLNVGQPGASATATPELALAPGYAEGGPTRTAYAAVVQAFIDASNPRNSHSGGGIYRTTDGGASWAPLTTPSVFDGGATAVAVAPDGRVFGAYTGTRNGLLCYWQGSWRAQCPAIGSGAQAAKAGSGGGSGSTGTGCTTDCRNAAATGNAVATASAAAAGTAGAEPSGGDSASSTTAAARAPSPNRPIVPVLAAVAIVAGVGAGWRAIASRRRRA